MTDPNNPDAPREPQVPEVPDVPQVPDVPEAPPTPPPAPPAYGAPPPQQAYGTPPPPSYGAPTPPPPTYGAPGAGQYAGGPTAKPAILSILSMVAGIVGIVGLPIAILPFVGGIMALIIPAAAVVLGFFGKAKEPQAKGFWLTGIITGFVGLAGALLSLVFWAILFSNYPGGYPVAPQ